MSRIGEFQPPDVDYDDYYDAAKKDGEVIQGKNGGQIDVFARDPRIVIEHIKPPVPSTKYDYRATFADYDEGDPLGHGPTPQSAVGDLLDQVYGDEEA
jgi:hypothetical protein